MKVVGFVCQLPIASDMQRHKLFLKKEALSAWVLSLFTKKRHRTSLVTKMHLTGWGTLDFANSKTTGCGLLIKRESGR